MNARKKIVAQALVCSGALAVLGIIYNGMPSLNKVKSAEVMYSIEAEEAAPAPAPPEENNSYNAYRLRVPTPEPTPRPLPPEIAHPGLMEKLDVNNVFNKVWGLFQALIVAWATYKFQQAKGK
jgi:hypothetical protein